MGSCASGHIATRGHGGGGGGGGGGRGGGGGDCGGSGRAHGVASGNALDSTLDPRLKAALDFKEDKSVTYTRGALQGVCNTMAMAEVMRGFVLPGASHPPDDVRWLHFDEPRDCDGLRWIATDCLPHQVRRLHFDALVIAEGEWSTTCSLLGITKAVDKFATAIGLIVNMHLDTSSPSSLRSFVATGVAPQLVQLAQAGLECENLEYLKGETHYIAATMRKKTLLAEGVLKADAVGPALLHASNVDIEQLLRLGRNLATFVGIPDSAPFADFHPVKLFDFSSRARCIAPFRVLGVDPTNQPCCLDLEVCACLREAQSRYLAHEVAQQQAVVRSCEAKRNEAAQAIETAAAAVAAAKEAMRAATSTHEKKARVQKLAEGEAVLTRAQQALPPLEAQTVSVIACLTACDCL